MANKYKISPLEFRNDGRRIACEWCEELLPRKRSRFCSLRCCTLFKRKVHDAELRLLYLSGWTTRQLSVKYGCDLHTVLHSLKRSGTALRPRKSQTCFCGEPSIRGSVYHSYCRKHHDDMRRKNDRKRWRNISKHKRLRHNALARLWRAKRKLATATAVACSC